MVFFAGAVYDERKLFLWKVSGKCIVWKYILWQRDTLIYFLSLQSILDLYKLIFLVFGKQFFWKQCVFNDRMEQVFILWCFSYWFSYSFVVFFPVHAWEMNNGVILKKEEAFLKKNRYLRMHESFRVMKVIKLATWGMLLQRYVSVHSFFLKKK